MKKIEIKFVAIFIITVIFIVKFWFYPTLDSTVELILSCWIAALYGKLYATELKITTDEIIKELNEEEK